MDKAKVVIGASLAVVVLGTAVGTLRLLQTPEWAIRFGNVAAREAAAKSIWKKSPERAEAGLRKLLADKSPEVRRAALVAYGQNRPASLASAVRSLTYDDDEDVANLAIERILEVPGPDRQELAMRLENKFDQSGWVAAHPRQIALVTKATLEFGDDNFIRSVDGARYKEYAPYWVSEYFPLLRDNAQAMAVLQLHAAELRPMRGELIDKLEALPAEQTAPRRAIIALLTAIDGAMRGFAPEDWRQTDSEPATAASAVQVSTPLDRFTVEAEWASDIQPNFQIGPHGDAVGLLLGEGAGGYMSWLKRDNGTVDIGSGRFRFELQTPGRYRLWARIWMENKCSNSTGMIVDGNDLGSFSDGGDIFGEWYWTSHRDIELAAGPHVMELQAMEDGVYVDKYAFLPADEQLDAAAPPPLNALYDASLPSSISFSMDAQSMVRGSTQPVTVWVRRNSPTIGGGVLEFSVPMPFVVDDYQPVTLRFPEGSPLARATFMVRLPADATVGEATISATLHELPVVADPADPAPIVAAPNSGRVLAVGQTILGQNFDWWTSESMPENDSRIPDFTRLALVGTRPDDLGKTWKRYPAKGFDPYRRLNFEWAFGQSQGTIVFLYTEILVRPDAVVDASAATAASATPVAGAVVQGPDDYVSLMSSDDVARIWIDGELRIKRRGNGPAEGNLQIEPLKLTPGVHHVFVAVNQADFPDPTGEDALRHTPNYWVFKWLIRRDRHTPAPGILAPSVQPRPDRRDGG